MKLLNQMEKMENLITYAVWGAAIFLAIFIAVAEFFNAIQFLFAWELAAMIGGIVTGGIFLFLTFVLIYSFMAMPK